MTAYNVYRFLFYGGDVVTQVDYFGQVQTLQSGTGTLTPNDQVALPLTRITGIEGPLPIPNENVAGFLFVEQPGRLRLAPVLQGRTEPPTPPPPR